MGRRYIGWMPWQHLWTRDQAPGSESRPNCEARGEEGRSPGAPEAILRKADGYARYRNNRTKGGGGVRYHFPRLGRGSNLVSRLLLGCTLGWDPSPSQNSAARWHSQFCRWTEICAHERRPVPLMPAVALLEDGRVGATEDCRKGTEAGKLYLRVREGGGEGVVHTTDFHDTTSHCRPLITCAVSVALSCSEIGRLLHVSKQWPRG